MTREEITEGLRLLEDNMVYFDELLNDKGKYIDVHELLFETIEVLEQEPKYCDRNICIKNEYNGIGCDECEVTKSQEPKDCISRAEAIKALEYDLSIEADGGLDKYRTVIKDLLNAIYNTQKKAIEQLPSIQPKPKTRWISVSERLPKAGEYIGNVAKYYLIQNEYGDMLVARYTHNEYWEQIYQMKPIADEIIAWMPLPEPYKVESEDKE